MNAITQTFADLGKTLAKAATPVPCIMDVVAWGAQTGAYRTFSFAMKLHVGATSFTPLSEAKASLERVTAREEKRKADKHWSYDPNRLIALRQMKAHIERFERETA